MRGREPGRAGTPCRPAALPAGPACLVLLPLYTASGDLFLFVFSHLPKCTAAPMTHLCLLFMLMRLTPLAIAIMCSLPAN